MYSKYMHLHIPKKSFPNYSCKIKQIFIIISAALIIFSYMYYYDLHLIEPTKSERFKLLLYN